MCQPCFSGCSRPEHSTVRCPGVSRHEEAHRLMASMGLFRLDDPSPSTQHSRTAGDTASSFSLISPRLLQVFLAIAFRLYIRRALSLAPVVELILFRPPACRFGQRFVSERDSWIPRPYGGIRSTLVLYSGRLVSAAARCANGDIAPFCRTFLSSVVFQGLVARVTRIRRSSRPSLPVLVFVRLRSTLSRIFPGDDFRRLLHHSIYCRWQFWTSFLISFRFPVASRSLSSYSRQSAEPF